MDSAKMLENLMIESDSLSTDEVFDSICVVRRRESNNLDRLYVVNPVSRPIRQKLLTQLSKLETTDHIQLLRHFSCEPLAQGMAGLPFEAYLQRAFAKEIKICAQPMLRTQHSRSRWHAIFNKEAQSGTVKNIGAIVPLNIVPRYTYWSGIELTAREDIYYIPDPDNAMAIDSFIVHAGQLYLFQFTVGTLHDHIKPRILDLPKQFHGLPPQDHWHLIFVVPISLQNFSTYPDPDLNFPLNLYTAQVAVATNGLY